MLFYSFIHFIFSKTLERVRNPNRFIIRDAVKATERIAYIIKTLSHIYSLETFVNGFFLGATVKQLQKENVLSFLCWAFFGKSYHSVRQQASVRMSSENLASESQSYSSEYITSCAELKQLEECYAVLEAQFPTEMKRMSAGFNPNAKHVNMCLTQQIPFLHRPFLYYFGLRVFDFFYNFLVMRSLGFSTHHVDVHDGVNGKTMRIRYWYRQGIRRSSTVELNVGSSTRPIVLLHGISHGWISYTMLFSSLSGVSSLSQDERSLILVQTESIRIGSLETVFPSGNAFSTALKTILGNHSYTDCTLVGHSFGSMLAGGVLRRSPEIIHSLVLLDPVCLLLSLPAVAYNFLYKEPRSLMDWVIYIFASREITISHTLYRNFIWWESDLWLEDVPNNVPVLVVLAENDEILDAPGVRSYCEIYKNKREQKSAPVEFLYFENVGHGQYLFNSSSLMKIQETLKDIEKSKADSV